MDFPRTLNMPNGAEAERTFSDHEVQRRLDELRAVVADRDIDVVPFASYHNSL